MGDVWYYDFDIVSSVFCIDEDVRNIVGLIII